MSLAPPTPAERAALAVLSAGDVAVMLAALPYKAFELDRFFVPKELVLHATATVTALLCLRRLGWVVPTRVDTCLAGYLALGFASALAAARPHASRARALYPSAPDPKRVLRVCGEGRRR